MRIRNSREALNQMTRRYHVEMLLDEISKAFVNRGGDTRGYLSFDEPETQILQELLEEELKRLQNPPHLMTLK